MMLGLYAACSCATITVEEARIIAQAHTSTSLDSAAVDVDEIPGGIQMARFRVHDGDHWVETVSVDMTRGEFSGVWRPRPEGTPSLSVEQCLGYAQAEAEAQMGDDAQNLTWGAELIVPEEVACTGKGPLVGTPPRSGLTPSCEVSVSTVNGTIIDFSDTIPEGEEPITPTVSAEDAEDIAIEATGLDGGTIVGAPELSQERGALTWFVTVHPPSGGNDWHCTVSATTGAVIDVGEPETGAPQDGKAAEPPAAPGASAPPTRAMLPPGMGDPAESAPTWRRAVVLPIVAVALLVCAAGGLVLLRRRR
jgi:hypothetical protein